MQQTSQYSSMFLMEIYLAEILDLLAQKFRIQ